MKIFSVFDSKAEAYLTPFFSQTAGTAIRSFSQAATDEEHLFSKHAADYTLFEIGEYTENDGRITPLQNFKNLGNAIEMKGTENGNT